MYSMSYVSYSSVIVPRLGITSIEACHLIIIIIIQYQIPTITSIPTKTTEGLDSISSHGKT